MHSEKWDKLVKKFDYEKILRIAYYVVRIVDFFLRIIFKL